MFGCRCYTVAGAALMIATLAIPAKADPVFGVNVSTNTVSSWAEPGCGETTSYTTSNGGSTNPNTGARGCSISASVPSAPGLTTATAQSSAQSTDGGDNSTITSTAHATSDLSTASLHAYSSIPVNPPTPGGASAGASWFDTLTFTIPKASSGTVTNIPVVFAVDGTATPGFLDGAGTGVPSGPADELSVGAGVRILGTPTTCSPSGEGCVFGTGDTSGTARWTSNTVDPSSYESGSTGLVAWEGTPQVQSLTDFTVDGTLSLIGPQQTIFVEAELYADAGYGTLDYSDTAGFSLQLPSGVTLSSASGQFLNGPNQPVPEPGSLMLLAGSLVGLGLLRRRTRPAGAVHEAAAAGSVPSGAEGRVFDDFVVPAYTIAANPIARLAGIFYRSRYGGDRGLAPCNSISDGFPG